MIWSPESELEVIGAALYAPDRCDVAFDRLKPDHFGDPVHARIWEAMLTLRSVGGGVGPALVRDRLGADEAFATFGGVRALSMLQDKANIVGLGGHVSAVADRYMRRRLEDLSRDLLAQTLDTASGPADALLHALETRAAEIARDSVAADAWVSGSEVIRRAVSQARNRAGTMEHVTGLHHRVLRAASAAFLGEGGGSARPNHHRSPRHHSAREGAQRQQGRGDR